MRPSAKSQRFIFVPLSMRPEALVDGPGRERAQRRRDAGVPMLTPFDAAHPRFERRRAIILYLALRQQQVDLAGNLAQHVLDRLAALAMRFRRHRTLGSLEKFGPPTPPPG